MKDNVKEIIKMILSHFAVITTVLITAMGILRLAMLDTVDWPWYFPFQIIGTSFPTACCSLVYFNKKELNRNQFLIRCAIHFLLLVGIVLGEGYLYKWWSSLEGFLIVISVFIGVYIVVWIITLIKDRQVGNKINSALKNIKEKEKENDQE